MRRSAPLPLSDEGSGAVINLFNRGFMIQLDAQGGFSVGINGIDLISNDVFGDQLTSSDLSPWDRPGAYKFLIDRLQENNLGAVDQANLLERLSGDRSVEDSKVRALLKSAIDPSLSIAVADSYLETVLRGLATLIDDSAVRDRFLDPATTEKELTEVLKYLPPKERTAFFQTLYSLSGVDSDVDQYLTGKLDNALFYYKVSEKMQLMRDLYQTREDPRSVQFMRSICRSSSYYASLEAVVHTVGEKNLLNMGDPELHEYASIVMLRQTFDKIKWPNKPGVGNHEGTTEYAADRLENGLSSLVTFLSENQGLVGSDMYRVYVESVLDNLMRLEGAKSQYQQDHNLESYKTAIGLVYEKIQTELTYGVLLTEEEFNPMEGKWGASWREKDIVDVRATLKDIGESKILMTPLLSEIERVTTLGPYVLAARFWDGVVRVASLTLDQPSISQMYGGEVSSLQAVLTHELGHALQIGLDGEPFHAEDTAEVEFGKGEPIYEFKDWLSISGWSVIPKESYTLSQDGNSVCIGDQELALGKAVEFNGKRVVLDYFWGNLITRDADAGFSSYDYSQTSPWEDFAEAFAEYHLTPERLIELAPLKYKFLEQEFHRHQFRDDLKRQLDERLARGEVQV